ncbi:hypothetical protein Aduo_009029 [Ancylostoma duodenale]
MSAEDSLNALRRFFALRHSKPNYLRQRAYIFSKRRNLGECDQRKESSINDVLSNNTIEWKNIIPYAQWQVGFYERLIKSIKHALYKCIGRAKLSDTFVQGVFLSFPRWF